MVFQKEETSSMFGFLRNLISKDNRDGKDSCKDCGDIEQGVCTEYAAAVADTERAYDIADALEGGLARETTSGFQHPLRRAKNLWKFKVVRSDDKLQYRLFSGNGDFLITPKRRWRNVRFRSSCTTHVKSRIRHFLIHQGQLSQ